ncbi:MAG: NAD(+) synthase [Tidjanibacter sp.]|nr:NAD(+) synthase [Tidjanibacter sp.]
MKIAVAQLNYTVGDFEGNKIKIINAVNRAKEQGVDLVVFSEYAVCGAPAYSLLTKQIFLDRAEETLVEIAAFCNNISVLVGLPIQQKNGTVSAAAFIQNRHVKSFVTKATVSRPEECNVLAQGSGCGYVSVCGNRVAVILGADIESDQMVAYSSCDLVVVMCADRFMAGCQEHRHDILVSRSFLSDKFFVFVNQVGATGGMIYDGGSVVYDNHCNPVVLMRRFDEDYAVAEIDNLNPTLEFPYTPKAELAYNALVLGLRDYFAKNNLSKALLVVSGGIDSSVTAALAAAALGADNVKALLMPSRYSTSHSAKDAELLVSRLGIASMTIPLSEIYNSCLNDVVPVMGSPRTKKIEEDFQMRLRTAIQMAACEQEGFTPLNSSNKTELAVGATTLYGDSSGILSVLGDLYKTEVYALARYINREQEIIPAETLTRRPSSEMQLTELGVELPPYDVIDAILYRIIERCQSTEEIVNAGFDGRDVELIRELIYSSHDKCYQFCEVLKLSTMPLDRKTVMLPKPCKLDF